MSFLPKPQCHDWTLVSLTKLADFLTTFPQIIHLYLSIITANRYSVAIVTKSYFCDHHVSPDLLDMYFFFDIIEANITVDTC